jgi:hypothetical protein
MEFKVRKVSFHLKEDGNVFVTTDSLVGNVVNLCGIWLADFSNRHLKVAIAYTVCSLGFLEPTFPWCLALSPDAAASA